MLESYIRTGDGKDYVDVDCIREALGVIDKDENIFLAIKRERDLLRTEIDNLKDNIRIKDNALKTVKKERDELKDKVDKLKTRANAAYGVSCGYSGDKAPAFRCDVINYSWEFAPIAPCSLMDEPSYHVRNDGRISVELTLTPTANCDGIFDPEDLRQYIQEYGREKKLGVLESVDYQNAKAARAELACLYKRVLGKERLDRDLSPHEIRKAIHDEYKRVRDSQLAFSQSLRSVYMYVHEGTDYETSDIYAAPEKLANGITTRYNSARMVSRLETLKEIDDHIDELCDKYTVVQPDRKSTTKERLDYIFGVLAEHRDLANSTFNKAEGFRKEKQALSDSLAELRAKVREIYRSIFCDCRWEDGYSYCSALNDIKEEYERVKYFFKEKNDELKEAKLFKRDIRKAICVYGEASYPEIIAKAREVFDRRNELIYFKGDVAKAAGLSCDAEEYVILQSVKALKGHSDAVEQGADKPVYAVDKDEYDKQKELSDKLARLRSNVCTALCLGGERSDEDILNAIAKMRDEINKRIVFRNDVAKAIGLTWADSNSDIVNRVMQTKECHDKLCEDYTELRKAIWEAMDRKPETLPEETAKLVGEVRMLQMNYQNMRRFERDYGAAQKILSDISDFRKWAIEELKQRGIVVNELEHPEHVDVTGSDIFRKLLKRYDWAYGEYKEQDRHRQMWHVRWESENERANGVQKKLDKLRGIEAERDKCKENCKYWHDMYDSVEAARGALTGKIRELKDEKTKVIAALGQDIWDDCLK